MHSKITQWVTILFVVLFVIFGAVHFLKGQEAGDFSTSIYADGFWQVFNEEAVEEGIMEGRPVFVNFTAAYCTVCKQNDVVVFNQRDIRDAFAEKNVLMLKGDMTRRNDLMLEWLRRHGRAGVPLYLLFVPGEVEPIMFPEVLSKSMIFDALNGF
jgi:thiol:disulfide interchange protein DsbD